MIKTQFKRCPITPQAAAPFTAHASSSLSSAGRDVSASEWSLEEYNMIVTLDKMSTGVYKLQGRCTKCPKVFSQQGTIHKCGCVQKFHHHSKMQACAGGQDC